MVTDDAVASGTTGGWQTGGRWRSERPFYDLLMLCTLTAGRLQRVIRRAALSPSAGVDDDRVAIVVATRGRAQFLQYGDVVPFPGVFRAENVPCKTNTVRARVYARPRT